MDVLGYALQMELDGEEFFRENAQNLKDKNAAFIIRRLAEEERKHYQIIKDFQEDRQTPGDSGFAGEIKNLFQQMKERGESFGGADDRTLDVLASALRVEDDAAKFYAGGLGKATDSRVKAILSFLKKEEDRHYAVIANLIEFFERPQSWNEQAEFNFLDEY